MGARLDAAPASPEAIRVDGDARRDGEPLLESMARAPHARARARARAASTTRRRGALICGDMVASVGTILIAPGDGDMRLYLEQLKRLGTLGARVALPAHGEPLSDPAEVFKRYVAHRLAREAKVLAALRATPRPLADIVPEAHADTPVYLWPVAALSLQAHLDKLVAEGRAARRPRERVSSRGVRPWLLVTPMLSRLRDARAGRRGRELPEGDEPNRDRQPRGRAVPAPRRATSRPKLHGDRPRRDHRRL